MTKKKLDDSAGLPVLDDGATPCFNPDVADGKDGLFLVSYESDGGPGKHVILTHIVKAKQGLGRESVRGSDHPLAPAG